MRWIKRVTFALIALYLSLTALIYFTQRSFLYFPPPIYLTPEAVELTDFDEIKLSLDESNAVIAWWSPPRDGLKTVMFFHGNGSAVFSNHHIYRELSEAGYGVLGIGYPGYPGGGGEPAQYAIIEAVQAQYEFLIEEGVPADQITFYGTSLGSGVAAQLSQTHQPSLLIMEAPFNSVLDMSRKRMPFLPVGLLLKDQYRSDKALAQADFPIIWIHGTNDRVIPLSQGQKLFDGYGGPKTDHIIPGGTHSNLWGMGGDRIIFDALAKTD